MMVTIDFPTSCGSGDPEYPRCCQGWEISVNGDYDVTGYKSITTAQVDVSVSRYDQASSTWVELDRETFIIPDPNMVPQGPWDVVLEVTQDYDGLRITAQGVVDGSGKGTPATVQPICIRNA
jgi:hypothetical protein